MDLLTATPHGRSARLKASSRLLVGLLEGMEGWRGGADPAATQQHGVGEWESGRPSMAGLLTLEAWGLAASLAGCWMLVQEPRSLEAQVFTCRSSRLLSLSVRVPGDHGQPAPVETEPDGKQGGSLS